VDIIGYVVVDELEIGVANEVGDVFGSASEEIVHADNVVSLSEK